MAAGAYRHGQSCADQPRPADRGDAQGGVRRDLPGVSVPGEMSVVGFDDIEMPEFYVPALTTIRQNHREL